MVGVALPEDFILQAIVHVSCLPKSVVIMIKADGIWENVLWTVKCYTNLWYYNFSAKLLGLMPSQWTFNCHVLSRNWRGRNITDSLFFLFNFWCQEFYQGLVHPRKWLHPLSNSLSRLLSVWKSSEVRNSGTHPCSPHLGGWGRRITSLRTKHITIASIIEIKLLSVPHG